MNIDALNALAAVVNTELETNGPVTKVPSEVKPLVAALADWDVEKAVNFKTAHVLHYDTAMVRLQLFNDGFLKKLEPDSVAEPLADTAALVKFFEQEARNKVNSERLANFIKSVNTEPGFSHKMKAIFLRWRMLMRSAFAGFRGYESVTPKLTTGATYNTKKGLPPVFKLQRPYAITEDCIEHLHKAGFTDHSLALFDMRKYHDDKYELVDGCIVQTVPKTYKISRIIAKEPLCNIAVQCGAGTWIRNSLAKKFGITIQTAQPLHGALAKKGSLEGALGEVSFNTIDLSSASDSICTSLVKGLLDKETFEFLNAIRSKKAYVPCGPGSNTPYWHNLHMWATSGNGFCFEFETLLFYTLIRAVDGFSDVYVYGDDMIVKGGNWDALMQALTFFGFNINADKSYSFGPFRESCGYDAHAGSLVRSAYVKTLPSEPIDWVRLANRIRHRYFYDNDNAWVDYYYFCVWARIIGNIEENLRLFGPRYLGDTCINIEDSSLYTTRRRKQRDEIKVYKLSLPKEAYVDIYEQIDDGGKARRYNPHLAVDGSIVLYDDRQKPKGKWHSTVAPNQIYESMMYGQATQFSLRPLRDAKGQLMRDENGWVIPDPNNRSHLVLDASHPYFKEDSSHGYNPAWTVFRYEPEITDCNLDRYLSGGETPYSVDKLFTALENRSSGHGLHPVCFLQPRVVVRRYEQSLKTQRQKLIAVLKRIAASKQEAVANSAFSHLAEKL